MLHETDPKDGHFDELKRLLFADEQKTLERLDRDVNTLSDRYGTPDKFEHAMAKSLATALKQADVEDHRRLAGAIAPLVVAGIRNEIAQSRDLMVEALYPITGRLVTTAVAKAFQRLVADINARLESAMSLGRWRLRLKALLTGRSYGELVLAEATAFRPQQMLLLDHQSGTLIGAWPSVAEGAEGGENLDLVGGMLSAILGFAEEALHAKSGGLRSLDLGGAKALISASPRFVLATIGQGSTAPQIEDAIDQAFLPFLEDLGGGDAGPLERNDADRSLEELHDAILDELSQIETSRQPKIAYFVLGALALAFAGVVGYQVWQSRIEAAFDAKLAVIEASPELAGYPLIANRDWDANVVHLRGLVPNGPARDVIIERTRAISGDAKVEAELVVVDTARISDTARQVAGVDARLSVLQERVAAAPVVDPKDIAVRLEELRQGASETARRAAGVDARLSALQERVAAAPVVDPDDIALRFDEVQQGASETAKG
ncbi:MAG TPA: hypothetical protein PLG99_01285, partial [Kaistiaceae bacterium]|nr:hypothetical protein [Kaistiaceae bacterium]